MEAIVATGVPYFDLSLQHASGRLLRKMRRWGDRARFLERIDRIRRLEAGAVLRSSFILGYPGETEEDHDELLRFIEEADLDWAGFFTFSSEEGTLAAGLGDQVPGPLALERLRECSELQDSITAADAAGSWSGHVARCSSTGPAVPGPTGKRRRSTASYACPVLLPKGWLGPVRDSWAPWGPTSRPCQRFELVSAGRRHERREHDFRPVGADDARERAHPCQVARIAGDGRACQSPPGLQAGCSSASGSSARPRTASTASSPGATARPAPERSSTRSPTSASSLAYWQRLAAIGEVSWLPVILIAVREVSMSVFRSYAGRRGVSVPARTTAKVKTLLQDLVIGLAFMPPVGLHHANFVGWALWFVVAVTLWTGLEYLRDSRKLLAGRRLAHERQRRPSGRLSASGRSEPCEPRS